MWSSQCQGVRPPQAPDPGDANGKSWRGASWLLRASKAYARASKPRLVSLKAMAFKASNLEKKEFLSRWPTASKP